MSTKVCPQCNSTQNATTSFCQECGYKFEDLTQPQTQTIGNVEMIQPTDYSQVQQPVSSGGGGGRGVAYWIIRIVLSLILSAVVGVLAFIFSY